MPAATSLLLGGGRLPRFQFQSLRAPTKPPFFRDTASSPHVPLRRYCARVGPRPLAPVSALSVPVTAAASPPGVEEDGWVRAAAAAVRFSAKAHSVWRSSKWQGARSRGRGGSCQEEKW